MFQSLKEHMQAIQSVETQHASLQSMAIVIAKKMSVGGCLYICGNGGSAADAQHLAAEFVGRFKKDRPPLRAVALTTDTSLLTAVGNDYGFNAVFERQVLAHVTARDALLCITTSGNSDNVLHAAHAAAAARAAVLYLSGRGGGALARCGWLGVVVGSDDTAAIQEAHLYAEHQLVAMVEELV